MMNITGELRKIGVVPVLTVSDPAKAVPLADALAAGGLPCVEITLRTPEGVAAIAELVRQRPGLLLGAGTVLTPRQADEAAGAGARFVVTPGFNPRVVDHCLSRGIPVIPGCATPGEMEQAMERGLTLVKVFPAQPLGGLAYLKAVAGPYPGLGFMPSGGIGPDNLADYLAFGKVAACGGSWMAPKALVETGDYKAVTALSAKAAAIVAAARQKEEGAHG